MKKEYGDIVMQNEELKKEILKLTAENEILKRKIFGLETTVSNYRRKEESTYRDMGWSK